MRYQIVEYSGGGTRYSRTFRMGYQNILGKVHSKLFPISRPHPFYEPHCFVHYAFIIDGVADHVNLTTTCLPRTVISMTDFEWPA